jgi:putative tryptophan/tyrosine transport system substrate-binding protein
VTGVTGFGHAMVTKQLELLHELVPKAAIFAALVNPNNPNTLGDLKDLQQGAATFGLQFSAVNVAKDSDFDPAFAVEKHDGAVDALVYLILGVIGDGIEETKVHYV